MDKVSRPMQIALLATALFAVLWFVALKPKNDAAEPIAAAPVTTPAATSRPVDAGGAQAQTGLGKAVESANNAAQTSANQAHAEEQETGEQTGTTPGSSARSNTTNAAPAAAAPAATTPAGTSPAAAAKAKAKAAKAKADSRAQRHADHVTKLVAKDLKARRAVIVLVSAKHNIEDRLMRYVLRKAVKRHHGRVKTYYVPVSQVGLYQGLVGSLNLSQTPSTIVIAPNNQAQVIGGYVSYERINRLTSSALQMKPDATPAP